MVVGSPLLLNAVLQSVQVDSILHISVESVIDRWTIQVPAEQYDPGYVDLPQLCMCLSARIRQRIAVAVVVEQPGSEFNGQPLFHDDPIGQ